MRCPKCSFISFDDLVVCAKCASDLSLLSRELSGTCVEARPEFFLGSAIQSPALDEDNFSDSQVLPPIDHAGINFDDTSTGGFSPLSSSLAASASLGLDDGMGMSTEDDIAIELGDIMPIDLDQLDDASVFSGDSLVDTNSFDSGDFALGFDKTETMSAADHNAIDLDLTGKFSSTNSELELDGDFSDIDIDDSTFDFASGSDLAGIGASPFDSGEASIDLTPFDDSGGINLDDELIAQLVSFNDDLDSSANFGPSSALSAAGEGLGEGATDSVELDGSLAAELTGAFPVSYATENVTVDDLVDQSGTGEFELDSALVAELANDVVPDEMFLDLDLDGLVDGSDAVSLADHSAETASGAAGEDLTGQFSAVAGGEELDLGGVFDVDDLVEPSLGAICLDEGSNAINLIESRPGDGGQADFGADLAAEDLFVGNAAEVPIEDLTGEFLSIDVGDDAVGLGDLALAEIDVSDLLEPSGEESVSVFDDAKTDSGAFGVDDLSDVDEVDPLDGDFPAEAAFAGQSWGGDGVLAGDLDVSLVGGLGGASVVSGGDLEPLSAQDAVSSEGVGERELFDEIDISELEAELNSSAGVMAKADDGLPEIELISDDDEGPPDLPR